MQWIAIFLLAAVTFGACYLFDKGFTRLFRNKPQHASGQAVRLQNREIRKEHLLPSNLQRTEHSLCTALNHKS